MNHEELTRYILQLKADPSLSMAERIRLWHAAMPPRTDEEKIGIREALAEKMAAVTQAREQDLAFDLSARH